MPFSTFAHTPPLNEILQARTPQLIAMSSSAWRWATLASSFSCHSPPTFITVASVKTSRDRCVDRRLFSFLFAVPRCGARDPVTPAPLFWQVGRSNRQHTAARGLAVFDSLWPF